MGASGTTPTGASVPADAEGTETAKPPASQPLRRRRRVSFAPSDGEAAPPATPREPAAAPAPTTPTHVFLDIAKQDFLKDPFVGKVVVELYTKDAPRTTHNFAELCRDKKYVNTPFHRIIKDFMVQGGDLVNQDGTGTYSVYGGEGATFADEAFVHAHDRPGLLSMANSGPNTNGSQFFITTAPAPHLDGKHVVFGRIVEGMEHVHDVEREVTDPNDRPIRRCYVMNCGVTDKPTGSTRTTSEPLQQTRMAQSPTPPAAQALQTYSGGGGGGSEMPAGAPTEPVPFQL
jgi:cyclophilin family peptidyl-prolyl cis-trans isomerase